MAWETWGKKQYLYLSYRDAEGRVRKQYLGTGEQAQANSAFLEAQKNAKTARFHFRSQPETESNVWGSIIECKKWVARSTCPTNTVIRKLMSEQFEKLRQELSEDKGTDKVEQLLNDQVAISLLQVNCLDPPYRKTLSRVCSNA